MQTITNQELLDYMEYHKMTTKKIAEINCTTGEEIIRDATAEELAQLELDKAELAKQAQELAAREKAKQDILDRIGLTADELETILT